MKITELNQQKINVFELAVMFEALAYQQRYLKESSHNKLDISRLCDAIAIKQQSLFRETLNEVELTQDQISDLFAKVVDTRRADAESKPSVLKNIVGAVGAGVSKAWQGIKDANELKNKLLQTAQDSKPVRNFDAKAEELLNKMKAKLGKASPKALDLLEKYIEWGKKNPVKQSLILAALVALVSFAATPAAGGLAQAALLKSFGIGLGSGISTGTSAAALGGVAGFILKTLNSMLMGEKASSAIAKGVAGGLVGAIAGMGIRQLADMFGDPIINTYKAVTDAGRQIMPISSFRTSVTIGSGSEVKKFMLNVMGTPDEITKLQSSFDKITAAMKQGDVETATSLLKSIESYNWKENDLITRIAGTDGQDKMIQWVGKFIGKDLANIQALDSAITDKQKTFMKGIKTLVNGLQAAAQGAATAAGNTKTKEKAAA